MATVFKYPCTGNISLRGFGDYLESQIGEPRRNINLFARELSSRFGPKYITLTNSGSSANLVAALALAEKITKKGKPLTAVASGFTFPTTMSSLLMAGFKVRLLDVEPGGFNLDADLLEKEAETPSLIAVTHFLGFPAQMKKIQEYAKAHGCFVLQDACETIDLRDEEGRAYFEYGDTTTWSFYHPHHISSYGGGAVITKNIDDYALVDSIAHWGRACKCHIDSRLCNVSEGPAHQFTYIRPGVNVEMSELNAAFGRWQLQNWEEIERCRLRNYTILYEALKGHPALQVWPLPAIGGSPFVFPIQLVNGMNIADAYRLLSAESIEIRTLMGGATCQQEAFRDKTTHDNQSKAIAMADNTFLVGIHHTLSEEAVKSVANQINETFIR